MSGALAGRRVLITRARHQAAQLATQLEAAGAETISIPTIEIAPPENWEAMDAALRQIHTFDWLVLTSANAVDSLQQRLAQLHLGPKDIAEVRFAVIGPATAAAVEAAGLRVALMPQVAIAEKLAEALGPNVAGKSLLLPQAKVARDLLAAELTRAGARVTVVEAYQNVVPEGSADKLRAVFADPEKSPHVVVFTSSSTAQNFFRLLQQSSIALPPGIALASIGPITSQTLRELGHPPNVEAEEHNLPGLVRALASSI